MKEINFEFIKEIFARALDLGDYELNLDSEFEEVPDWDSLGHMRIIFELESELGIEFEIDEIVGIDTVQKVIDLAQSKID